MNFLFGLVSLVVIVYLFLYFRPREKESLIVMGLSCVSGLIHTFTNPASTVFVALVLAVLQAAMVLCCFVEFKDEYLRRKKKRKAFRANMPSVQKDEGCVTA